MDAIKLFLLSLCMTICHGEMGSVLLPLSIWVGLWLCWTTEYGRSDALLVLGLIIKRTGTFCFLTPGVLSGHMEKRHRQGHEDTSCVSDDYLGCLASRAFRWLSFQPLSYCNHTLQIPVNPLGCGVVCYRAMGEWDRCPLSEIFEQRYEGQRPGWTLKPGGATWGDQDLNHKNKTKQNKNS